MGVSDWSDMFPDTITVKQLSSRDEYGKPTYGSGTDYSGRVVYKNSMVRSREGEEVLAKGHVWLKGTPTIDPEDQLLLPDSTTPPILSTEKYPDEDGDHHVKVYFG